MKIGKKKKKTWVSITLKIYFSFIFKYLTNIEKKKEKKKFAVSKILCPETNSLFYRPSCAMCLCDFQIRIKNNCSVFLNKY